MKKLNLHTENRVEPTTLPIREYFLELENFDYFSSHIQKKSLFCARTVFRYIRCLAVGERGGEYEIWSVRSR